VLGPKTTSSYTTKLRCVCLSKLDATQYSSQRRKTSVGLLNSLESFLSTFQKDLSAVSGQISDLQDRSKDIENRLKSRRVPSSLLTFNPILKYAQKIEKPLSNLITDITIPPYLATLILDSDVGEAWILSIEEFERQLDTAKGRSRVKAARDLGEVSEGLRIVVCPIIPLHNHHDDILCHC
jgi:hypothetical protein